MLYTESNSWKKTVIQLKAITKANNWTKWQVSVIGILIKNECNINRKKTKYLSMYHHQKAKQYKKLFKNVAKFKYQHIKMD
jgi:hypothetical protein